MERAEWPPTPTTPIRIFSFINQAITFPKSFLRFLSQKACKEPYAPALRQKLLSLRSSSFCFRAGEGPSPPLEEICRMRWNTPLPLPSDVYSTEKFFMCS